MAKFATGTFSSNTSTGDQVIDTGFGSAATAIMFWGTAIPSASINSFQTYSAWFQGIAAGANQAVVGIHAADAQLAAITRRYHSTTSCIVLVNTDGSIGQEAAFVSFNSDGTVTINWSTASGTARTIHWAAWQCDAAEVLTIQSPTSTGSQSYSPSIDPDVAISLTCGQTATGATTHLLMGIGIGLADLEQCTCGFASSHMADPTQTNRVQTADQFVSVPFQDATWLEGPLTDLSDGNLTVNWTTVPALARYVSFLLLEGVDADIVSTAEHTTTTGNRTESSDVDPEMLMFMGIGAGDANGTLTAISRVSFGAATGAGGHCTWHGDRDNVATTVVKRRDSDTYVYISAEENTPAVQAECEIVSFGTGGWDEHWDTADGNARPYFVLAMASPAAGGSATINPFFFQRYVLSRRCA